MRMNKAVALDSDFARAVSLHQKGKTADAVKLYRKIVRQAPRHPAAFNLLGVAHSQLGEFERAASCFERAIALKPDDAEAHNNLATMLRALNRLEDSILHYEKAVLLKSDYAEAHFNLGTALNTLGRHEEAIHCYNKALALKPDDAKTLNNIAAALEALNRYEEAILYYEKALILRSNSAEMHFNFGNALRAAGRHEQAVHRFEQAIALKPDFAEAHYNLGNALQTLGRYEQAIQRYNKALALKPDHARAHNNLGSSLYWNDRYEDAVRHYDKAIALKPDFADAHMNRGSALSALDRHEEANRSFDQAIAINPGHVETAWNKGLFCLKLGRFAEGWELFELRWKREGRIPKAYTQPRWNGERIQGALLAWNEQGLGDQILFSSLIPELKRYASQVILEAEPRLVNLFTRSFPGVTVVGEEKQLYAGPVQAQIPIGSLGGFLRPNWQSFPRLERGYLVADAARAAMLRQRLTHNGRFVIGLSWSSQRAQYGTFKSAPLIDFEALLRQPGCRFLDLQYGDTREEREQVERQTGIRVERLDDIDNMNDIDGLAALITACDLVVTVSNTTAHLAGALGKPTWILVPNGYGRFWYWFDNEAHGHWYPHVTIRRRAPGRTWAELIAALAKELPLAAR